MKSELIVHYPETSIVERQSGLWKPILIFTVFTVGLITLILIYYNSQKSRIFDEQKDNLSSIAILKLKQFELWHQERIGNATAVRDNQPLVDIIHQYIESSDNSLNLIIQNWMGTMRSQYDYSDILVVDTTFKIKMSFSNYGSGAIYDYSNSMNEKIMPNSIRMTDIKRYVHGDSLYIDLQIPLIHIRKQKPQIFGFLILRINPSIKLFPIIKLWPTSSKSSETLLFRKEGDSILYLNELRHKPNTALKLRLPNINESLLATQALEGQTGIVEGVDYRNVPVIGYIIAMDQLSWFMVTKTDKAELLAPVSKYLYYSLLTSALVLIINIILFLNWAKNQRIKAAQRKIAADKSEQQLKASETLYRNLFENMLNGFAYCKMLIEEGQPLDFLYIKVNKAFVNLTGLESVEGKRVSEVIPGIQESDHELLERYQRVSNSGEDETFETYVESLKMWFLVSVYSPEKGYFVAVFDVITERKNAELALRESEDKFKYVFDHSVIGKSITLPTGEVQVNKAFCDMTGYSAEELSKLKWQDITHPEDIELTQKIVDSLLDGDLNSVRFSKRYIRKDGSILWVDLASTLRYDSKGKPLYFMTAIHDITEQKYAEEILRNDEKRLRNIIESLPQLFWTCRPDGPCDYLSRQWLEYTGISESEQLGYGWLEQIHPEDRERVVREWTERVKSGDMFDIEFRIRRHDGEFHLFQTRAIPMRNNGNTIVRWLGSNTDIDTIRKAEVQLINYNKDLEQSVIQRTEQLEIANKELEAFSYSVSHDLRAPLRSVHGFTKILQEDYDKILDEEGRRICNIISSSANQMSGLIDDLLSFSRIGRSSVNLSYLNMEAMASNTSRELTGSEDTKEIKFSIGKLHEVKADSNLIKHVWNNLISNAIKYSSREPSPEIIVNSRKERSFVIYSVKDNGVGFDMQYANKLFGVFQRLHSESEFEGNGVGLAIVQRIISRHGGKIWAESEVGKGATFYFSLPVNSEQ